MLGILLFGAGRVADSESEVEVESEVESESEVEREVESEVESEVEREVESEVESEVEREVEREVESEVEREVESEVESEVEREVDVSARRAHRARARPLRDGTPAARCPICSPRSAEVASFTIENHCTIAVHVAWRDFDGGVRQYGTLAPGIVRAQPSYVGHRWEIADDDGRTVARHVVAEDGEHVVACP